MLSRAAASSAVLAAAFAVTAGCNDTALVLELASDLDTPGAIDGVCVSVAAVDTTGDAEAFGRVYAVGGPDQPTGWPQTLTVTPGDHDRVQVWARALKNGIEVARAGARESFSGGAITTVPLDLGTCPGPSGGMPRVAGAAAGSFRAVLAPLGWREAQIVALEGGAAQRFAVDGGALSARDGGLPGVPPDLAGAIAFDADGDCDDDLVVVSLSDGPIFWRQDGAGAFVEEAGALPGGFPGAVLAAADPDGDGDVDVALGAGGALSLWRNDGAGRFQEDVTAVPTGAASDVTALAFGDVSLDGHADLIVGQGSGADVPNRLLVNDGAGTGNFELAPAALPALPNRARALVVADLDADGDRDLAVAGAGQPVRLYVNRGDGRLEDRSFVRLPSTAAEDATAILAGDFDGDCHVDLVVARSAGAAIWWRGTDSGVFEPGTLPAQAAGAAAALGDADGDARPDLLFADPAQGVTWIAPR